MEQKQLDSNEVQKKVQKKSEKDKNGMIGGVVFGTIALFISYPIYNDEIFEFPIGKILVYIIAVFAFICFAVAISSFLILKNQKN